MTTPPEDFENDPTGMRDLLRSLPDPGPMPPEVADRITAALVLEQQQRASSDHSNVTPLTRPDRPAGTARPASRKWLQVVGGLVAAAAVAAVAVVGVNSLHHDNAPTSAVPSPTSVSGDQLAERVHVQSSGTNYTPANFNAQAASMATDTSATKPDPSLITDFGSITKRAALLGCARSIAGALLDDPSSIKVDLATFEGKPAVVIVVTNAGKRTAFAVSRTCSRNEQPYAAPRVV
ncbi:hypothetical protein [Flexivirga caeni]|uniref:Uncharacterized protein n=1 Tax=Flexivirga caeni TaxID=2294115 RepID=A0A3M9M266_9MICO|nr:hypothetical protein [Flexivirga caeni]RNI19644.1 hypothetical protein EFY87_16225 [Flexivirga caeni]